MEIKTKSQLTITLKLFKNDGSVYRTTFRKLKRFYYIIQKEKFKKAYLKVRYKPKFYNDGEYQNNEDLVHAFKTFTEKELIQYFNKGD